MITACRGTCQRCGNSTVSGGRIAVMAVTPSVVVTRCSGRSGAGGVAVPVVVVVTVSVVALVVV